MRDELRNRVTGGIYFTTLQKFGLTDAEKQSGMQHPLLTDRRNVIVVDKAHRSHYDDLDGYARHLRDALPNATLIAFTGTPISFTERDTRAVFGDYIDIYDLTRAVGDGATVPVYFEPRLIKVSLAAGASEEDIDRAADLVKHWEQRRERMTPFLESPGKALIVGGTREICARLCAAIVALRPDWHSDALERGRIKVVYSGSASDVPPVSDHVRRDSENKAIKARLKDPSDELELVIVKDMMLTGFDAPPLHTLYLDRPLKGALLMQTLARVNRTFRGKQDGLLVAYAPLADNLAKALSEYTVSDQENKPIGRDVDEAVGVASELVAQIRQMLAGCDWRSITHEGGSRAWRTTATTATNFLRDAANPFNAVELGAERLSARYRTATGCWPAPGRWPPAGTGSPNCAKRSPSTKKCGCGWRSSMPLSGSRATSRSPKRSRACSVPSSPTRSHRVTCSTSTMPPASRTSRSTTWAPNSSRRPRPPRTRTLRSRRCACRWPTPAPR